MVRGFIDPFTALTNNLSRSILTEARRVAKKNGLRLKQPHRIYTTVVIPRRKHKGKGRV
ncbi:MAG: hypothetical protein ACXQS1_02655 [Methermicoccaceae archaeon]